ncbi:hypothetical protein ABHA52_10615 [Enterococcus faecium]|uniref:hypothetical protein n=1 Tax=Enterococcus faecium TaxID=1352 RepID=UPI001106D6D3|nr:hypothetical protein [Enterococcus faecium]MDB7484785.1 hypothetical protein [Enterococcus faecium]MDB7489821.1 hypothetical protein [Enterococcus faecium]MDB7492401.1 hypothetical protein [Enterococcus faecium]MDB7495027.1 hypothetical protein [Enterococcus faecium]MDB7497487.1 hypothetical protein [Enterococcus faecium]
MTKNIKTIKYKKEDYLKALNQFKSAFNSDLVNIKEIQAINREIYLNFNKYDFQQIDTHKIFKKSKNIKDFVTEGLITTIADNYLVDYLKYDLNRLKMYKTLCKQEYHDLQIAVKYRLERFYQAFSSEYFKIYTLLKTANDNKIAIEIYSNENLDNFLGIDFIVKVNDIYLNIHSINGSNQSFERLEEKYQKKVTIYLKDNTKYYFDRTVEYIKDLHLPFTDGNYYTSSTYYKIKEIEEQAKEILYMNTSKYNKNESNQEFNKYFDLINKMKKNQQTIVYC